MNRELDPVVLKTTGNFVALNTVWSDYDEDTIYGDYADGGADERSYEPGIGMVDPWIGSGDTNTAYYHTDHLGTTRNMTDAGGSPIESLAYTAFGERIAGTNRRFGYAGAWGYQTDETGEFPFLHVGARYYDPSSGRFLQRDPIGILGGPNVYAYTGNNPTSAVDPNGLQRIPVKGIDVPPDFPGRLRWPIRPPVPPPPTPPFWRPPPIGPPQVMMCVAAAGVGYGTGRLIDKGVEKVTGKSLSDRIGEAWFRWRNGGQCPGC